jgi:SPASM domain peptide maturase of grasp-with-spasm system
MITSLNEQYPILFACNLPVKGIGRAVLCDVQRQIYQYIPLSMYDVLVENEGKTLTEIKVAYGNEHDAIIDDYFNELVKEEWVFFTDTPQYFPKIDLFWEEPTPLTNAIIDIDKEINIDFNNIFEQFSDLGCEHIQIRCFSEKALSYFQAILDTIGSKRIISIEFIVCYQPNWTTELLTDFCEKNARIASFMAYSAPENKTVHVSQMGNIFLYKDAINGSIHCGKISTELFVINIKAFTEAQQHNTCLNKKISIDTEGYIRNCPSMKEHYGNIKDTTLQAALEHANFKKYWFVNKDQITVCKDCEFRHICTDCRAYRENPDDLYSKPLKCGYNPYTCEWEEWSTNPLKQEAIDFYGMREMVA